MRSARKSAPTAFQGRLTRVSLPRSHMMIAMTSRRDQSVDAATVPRSVPRYLALLLLLLTLVTGGLALHFASAAARANTEAEILMDGVDRSGLTREEAVAIAQLAQSRSSAVPDSEFHDHDHGGSDDSERTLSPKEQEEFEAQWAEAVAQVEHLDTLEEITKAGYAIGSGHSDGAGVHYIKWSLIDKPFDPAQPSMLLFDELKRGEEPELIAYSYWVTSDGPPEGFVGDGDVWHRHLGVCFENGYIKDEHVERSDCDGDWVNGVDMWMLHAWVVPGLENEFGQFHTVNPFLCERVCGREN